MKISLYLNYFNPAHLISSEILRPIQTGRAKSRFQLAMPGDDSGDSISEKNPSYCELTGQYWVWKNEPAPDYIGFMHYRRLFDFFPEKKDRKIDPAGIIIEDKFTVSTIARYGWNDADIAGCVAGVDMVLPERWDVTVTGNATIYDQYRTANFHHVEDLDTVGEIIQERSPTYYEHFITYMNSSSGFFTNMFIFRREIFEEYSAWLFDILDTLDHRLDTTRYNTAERRVIGYIAERLLGVFVTKKLAEAPELKVKYLRRVFIKNTEAAPQGPRLPDTSLPVVSIVAASDMNYVAHLAALVASIFTNASHSNHIEMLVLDGGLSIDDRRGIVALEKLHPSCGISFIDMSTRFVDIPVHMYFTRATFYRLALPELMPNRKRVLFIDTDAIVLDDLSKVFFTELNGKSAAAVRDLIMTSFVSKGVPSFREAGSVTAMKYLADYVGLGKGFGNYFQAGLILFDLDRLREKKLGERMISELRKKKYWFLDQDVLNKYLLNDIVFLDSNWNSVSLPEEHRDALPAELESVYANSRDFPSMIHYAGSVKPWNDPSSELAHYYWYYLRMTLWYERQWIAASGKTITVRRKARRPGTGVSLKRRVYSKIWQSMPNSLRQRMFGFASRIDQKTR